jgi:hypothetical protein
LTENHKNNPKFKKIFSQVNEKLNDIEKITGQKININSADSLDDVELRRQADANIDEDEPGPATVVTKSMKKRQRKLKKKLAQNEPVDPVDQLDSLIADSHEAVDDETDEIDETNEIDDEIGEDKGEMMEDLLNNMMGSFGVEHQLEEPSFEVNYDEDFEIIEMPKQ